MSPELRGQYLAYSEALTSQGGRVWLERVIPDLIAGQRQQLDDLPIFGADDKVRVHRSNITMLQNIEKTLREVIAAVDKMIAEKQGQKDDAPPEDSA